MYSWFRSEQGTLDFSTTKGTDSQSGGDPVFATMSVNGQNIWNRSTQSGTKNTSVVQKTATVGHKHGLSGLGQAEIDTVNGLPPFHALIYMIYTAT